MVQQEVLSYKVLTKVGVLWTFIWNVEFWLKYYNCITKTKKYGIKLANFSFASVLTVHHRVHQVLGEYHRNVSTTPHLESSKGQIIKCTDQ